MVVVEEEGKRRRRSLGRKQETKCGARKSLGGRTERRKSIKRKEDGPAAGRK